MTASCVFENRSPHIFSMYILFCASYSTSIAVAIPAFPSKWYVIVPGGMSASRQMSS